MTKPHHLTAVVLAFALYLAASSSAASDPRLCGGTRLQCGKDAAQAALVHAMQVKASDPNWGAVITCRGYAGLLRYRCTWRNGTGNGSALVILGTAPGWKATVTARS